mgnify:CR=1 FL=1
MDNVIKACNPFWGSIIKKMDFDFFNEVIKFDVTLIDGEIETNHTLEIRDYESLLWLEKSETTHEEYDFKGGDYYEFTAITFGSVKANSEDKWLKQYLLEFNITIEIWESALLVKAKNIIVDGLEYDL